MGEREREREGGGGRERETERERERVRERERERNGVGTRLRERICKCNEIDKLKVLLSFFIRSNRISLATLDYFLHDIDMK